MRLQKLGESFMRQFENSDDSADSDVGEDQAFIAKSGPQVGCARRSSDEIRGEHKDSDSESLSERESESENESESESESNSESDESRAVGDDESNSHTSGIKRRKSHAKGEEDTSPTCRRKVMGRATGFANNSQNTRTRVVSQKIQKRQPLVVDATGYGNMNNKFQETAMRKERQNFLSAKVSDVHTKVGREQKSMELGDKFSGNYLDWMEDVHKEVEKLGRCFP
ncbi:hypothetical protein SARC_03989 [Sphaeroforma arctica JP610]|uniref:Uncharacterized protein n=1 Tax=Sphaeroforma arctica JP610 TaxID=667725 RepID=A0A0L0G3Y9_9EUKA|nr:hypothetical protein SARC_03989 [Sphaeroforma arctica JP610]KNC83765.1 hypothetical protein SARC_03989 [Sphaeroforma arctica JP610]|eukprot:XP_014157667.1 hypothetical protein SARC_03989 [Sphaeroforma arctica JP610]